MKLQKEIGEKYKRIRECKGYTQRDVANRLMLEGSSNVSKFEKGVRNPTIESLKAFADAINCNLCIDFVDMGEPHIEYDNNEIWVPIQNKNYLRKIKIKDVKLEEKEKMCFPDDEEYVLGGFELASVQMKIQLLKYIMDTKILDSADFTNNTVVSILFEEEDSLKFQNTIRLLSKSVMSSEMMDTMVGELFGEEIGWRITNLVAAVWGSGNELRIGFDSSIFPRKLSLIISKYIEEEEQKFFEYKEYLKQHPNGLPYICYWGDINDDLSTGDIEVVEAWSERDAINIYLKKREKYYIKEFYDNNFVEYIAQELFYCGYEDLLETINDTNYANSFLVEIYDKYFVENTDYSEKQFEKIMKKLESILTKERLLEELGIDAVKRLWFQSVYNDVTVVLDQSKQEIYRYLI